jgi:hypothetical protein
MKIETITYRINWSKLKTGYSFFVPCIDTKAAKQTILQVTRRLQIDVVMRVQVEEGIKGVRVWRV